MREMPSTPLTFRVDPSMPVLHSSLHLLPSGIEVRVEIEGAYARRPVRYQQAFAYLGEVQIGFLRWVSVSKRDYRLAYPNVFQYIRKQMGVPLRNETDLRKHPNRAAMVERAKIQMRLDERLFGKPVVDFVYTADGTHPRFPQSMRRQRVASTLYLSVAEYLAVKGVGLHGSPLRNSAIEGLWKGLADRGHRIEWMDDPYLTDHRMPVLDLRGSHTHGP